jgi:hypothetical protein
MVFVCVRSRPVVSAHGLRLRGVSLGGEGTRERETAGGKASPGRHPSRGAEMIFVFGDFELD